MQDWELAREGKPLRDGTIHVFDARPLLDGEVFRPLRDPERSSRS